MKDGQKYEYQHQGYTANVWIDHVAKAYRYELFDKAMQNIKTSEGVYKHEENVYDHIKDVIEDVKKNPMDYYTA